MRHSERLDRLPFTRLHTKLLTGSGIGWALDAMDVGLISFVILKLGVIWQLTDGQKGWILSAGFIGMTLGASLGGLLADKIGRRQVFALTLLIYGLATGASALTMGVGALIALRVLVGLGLGAELPVASTLVSEFAPARIRGRIIVILEAFWALGWTCAALIGYLLVPRGDVGWRWALALGAVPAIYAIFVRAKLPESVRFLLSKGRVTEADQIVADFERAAGLPVVADESETVAEEAAAEPAPGVGALWSPALRRRSIVIALVWFFVNFSYYGAFTWLPSLLVKSGIDITKSLQYMLLITVAQIPGYAAAAVTIEKWGRRPTLAVFLAGAALSAAIFSQVHQNWSIITVGMMLSFFNLGAWGALYASTPELFPTALRGTGAGWAAGFGRIASIIGPLVVPAILALGLSTSWVFALFGVSFLAACLLSLGLPELKGTDLE
ncbi:MAG: MFS transporter [Propionibacteriaceae bacterium]|nr:MFS transporter [Propionibacteriaceae bacterium]